MSRFEIDGARLVFDNGDSVKIRDLIVFLAQTGELDDAGFIREDELDEYHPAVESLIDNAVEDARQEMYSAGAEETEEKVGEALSELDEVRRDAWMYHLDNHPGPIAYCRYPYCNEDTRASLVASILRGE